MFTTSDAPSCFADGSNGTARVPNVLIDLLEGMFKAHPRGGEGLHWKEASAICDELALGMDSDLIFDDIDEAIAMLNERCVDSTVFFEMHEGDLLLSLTDEEKASQVTASLTWHVGTTEEGEFYAVTKLPPETDCYEWATSMGCYSEVGDIGSNCIEMDNNGYPWTDVKELHDAFIYSFGGVPESIAYYEGGVPRTALA